MDVFLNVLKLACLFIVIYVVGKNLYDGLAWLMERAVDGLLKLFGKPRE